VYFVKNRNFIIIIIIIIIIDLSSGKRIGMADENYKTYTLTAYPGGRAFSGIGLQSPHCWDRVF